MCSSQGKTRAAHTALTRALHFARLYNQNLDIVRVEACKIAWLDTHKPKKLLDRVLTSRRVHSQLDCNSADRLEVPSFALPEGLANRKVFILPLQDKGSGSSSPDTRSDVLRVSEGSLQSAKQDRMKVPEFSDMRTIAEADELRGQGYSDSESIGNFVTSVA